MRRTIGLCVALTFAVMLSEWAFKPTEARAPATRQAIHKASKVFGRLDPAEHPRYSDSFFLVPDGRQNLIEAVQIVLGQLLVGTSTADWCPDILLIADNQARFFDVTRTPNVAQAAFGRDWAKLVTVADCRCDRRHCE